MESCLASLTFKQMLSKFHRKIVPILHLGYRQRWALLPLRIDAFNGAAELKLLHFLFLEGLQGVLPIALFVGAVEASYPEMHAGLGQEVAAL